MVNAKNRSKARVLIYFLFPNTVLVGFDKVFHVDSYLVPIFIMFSVMFGIVILSFWEERTGPSCSKLTTSLVNVTLKFQTYYT